jgi:hypothetical protein
MTTAAHGFRGPVIELEIDLNLDDMNDQLDTSVQVDRDVDGTPLVWTKLHFGSRQDTTNLMINVFGLPTLNNLIHTLTKHRDEAVSTLVSSAGVTRTTAPRTDAATRRGPDLPTERTPPLEPRAGSYSGSAA